MTVNKSVKGIIAVLTLVIIFVLVVITQKEPEPEEVTGSCEIINSTDQTEISFSEYEAGKYSYVIYAGIDGIEVWKCDRDSQ